MKSRTNQSSLSKKHTDQPTYSNRNAKTQLDYYDDYPHLVPPYALNGAGVPFGYPGLPYGYNGIPYNGVPYNGVPYNGVPYQLPPAMLAPIMGQHGYPINVVNKKFELKFI